MRPQATRPAAPHAKRTGVAPPETHRSCATPFESVALLLQGGGALGAYQAGVYEALHEAGIEPTWIAGISIGAINSAIIAGNPREHRVARLRAFWEQVSAARDGGWADQWTRLVTFDAARGWLNQLAAGQIVAGGVPGFFTPRLPPPYLTPPGSPGATSWYDAAALRSTLERLVDFDLINAKAMRFSVGAVNVRTGNFAYFDNEIDTIGPEHVMASGALPPAFEAVEIEDELYWDGGLVSNTPLDWVLSAHSALDTLIFQVDLWSARGDAPRDLSEVAVRMKEVQFSSRTRAATDTFRRLQHFRATFNELLAKMPPELAATPQARMLAEASDPAVYNIIQLVYRSPTYEGQSKDYEFSRRTMEEHWLAGRRDALATLAHPEVLIPPTAAHGVEVYDFVTPSARVAPPSKKE
ncbi:patatin-like phospholipase family protein [Phenylobacterium sp. LH3H17]|uniref:patatin-like phospholipase family protein n=1 Tax=Phenylobacterium sp. LH3H17 TaxID=2903901 RepID=UPI0020C9DEC7|nr:patatin-like phospholipase family protein [Phenylobacterium sp. LH3H17]UTP40341.1 patatin-like phospholipase family protein [Phenylobacterium sp. LH3H17]